MAFIPSTGSVVAFQLNPANLQASVTGTVAITGSVITTTPNQSISGTVTVVGMQGASVSGTVGASIIGTAPVTQAGTWIASVFGNVSVLGTVPVTQVTSPWVVNFQNSSVIAIQSGSVVSINQGSIAAVIIGGSIAASFIPPANQSVSGTVQTQVQASVAVVIIGGSILTSSTANQSVSGTVGSSIIGTVPVTQTTSPWIVNYQNSSIIAVSTGSVVTIPTGNQSISGTITVGSVLAMPGIVSTVNSTSTNQIASSVFTGTSEEWKDFGTITINVFADAASATDGLSIQQSSNGTNWDITDTYTVPSMLAGQGKTFGLQPAARFGRVVYTNGASASGQLRLQTIYHPQYTKPSSQRPSDGYTNESDLEQSQAFNMVYDDTSNTWYRQRGNSSIGTLIYTASSIVARVTGTPSISGTVLVNNGSVVAFQGTNPWLETFSNSSILAVPVGSVITVFQAPSIVGTYAEDAPSASGDKGFLVMGARNDTLSSVTSADGDYSSHVVGPAGELIAANSPFTKWISGTASMLGGTPVTGSLVPIIAAQGASVFTYITGVQIANASGTNAWITLLGATNSVIGYTVAPANGGSNIYYQNGLKTNANAAFSASISAVASVYVSAQGFIAKI